MRLNFWIGVVWWVSKLGLDIGSSQLFPPPPPPPPLPLGLGEGRGLRVYAPMKLGGSEPRPMELLAPACRSKLSDPAWGTIGPHAHNCQSWLLPRALTNDCTCAYPSIRWAWANDLACAYPSFDLIGCRLELGTKDLGSQSWIQRSGRLWARAGNNRLAGRSPGWSIAEDNGLASVDLSLETMAACRRTIGGLVEQ